MAVFDDGDGPGAAAPADDDASSARERDPLAPSFRFEAEDDMRAAGGDVLWLPGLPMEVPQVLGGRGAAEGSDPSSNRQIELAQAATAADLPTPPIGRVEKVSGAATATRNGVPVALHLGDPIFKGDVVETGSGGTLTLKFTDGTVLALSSSAHIVLSEMVYAASTASSSVFFRMLEGVVGLVAGASARVGDFAVETPTAVMGIRGTAVRIEVLSDGATRFSLMREPNGSAGSIVIFDKADRSRIVGSITETGAAAIVSVGLTTGTMIVRVPKSAEELRAEGDLVRELFQLFPGQGLRRGSGEPNDDLIVPASISPVLLEVRELSPYVPAHDPIPVQIPEVRPSPSPDIVISGTAREDGPAVILVLAGDGRRDDVPAPFLPEGVTFDPATGEFRLDPSHRAFQRLGDGETQTVLVNHVVLDGGTLRPATVAWTLTGSNDRPTARPDGFRVGETGSTVLKVLANDRDMDGDDLFIVGWTAPLEGSLVLDRNGELVFVPGDDFAALSAGQTATVSFLYTVADRYGASHSSTAVVTVRGEGEFSAPAVTARDSGTMAGTGQQVVVEMTAPSRTTKTSADVELVIDFGLVLQRSINIVYMVDVSGSTSNPYGGAPVGDLNGDGLADTVLDAEIAGLIELTENIRALGFSPADVTVTLIPFNDAADPSNGASGMGAVVFDLGSSGDETIANALQSLTSGGGTNFEEALRASLQQLAILDPERREENFIAFLSDGDGAGAFADEVAAIETEFGAIIEAIGIGPGAVLDMLGEIDSDGQVIRLTARDGIDPGFLGFPNRSGEVARVDLTVNGRIVPGVGIDDLVPLGEDFALRVEAEMLARFAGDANTVVATVTFMDGLTLSTTLDIFGALPRSTDFTL